MIRILFVTTTLDGGGAEKILLETVKELSFLKKYEIHVLSILGRGIYCDEIKQFVKYSYIFKNRFSKKFNRVYFSLLLRLLKIIPAQIQHKIFVKMKYDLEIAFLEGAPTKLVSGGNAKKFAWVHVDPISFPNSKKAYIFPFMEKITYKKYDKILCVSSDVRKNMITKFSLNEKNIFFQMNILNEKQVIKKSVEYIPADISNGINLVTIGRLAPQKNYGMLLKVVNELINEDNIDFKLYIIGEGEERNDLQEFINTNHLDNNVFLLGFIDNPYPYIKYSDLFVCSSIAEGFSTAVTESLILGVPVVTTDCAGMRDLLGNSEYGIICENSYKGLYESLYMILTNNDLLKQYKSKAKERSNYFSKEKRINEVIDLLDQKDVIYE